MRGFEPLERHGELGRRAPARSWRVSGASEFVSSIMSRDRALPVADGRLERHRILDEVEELPDALEREAGVLRDLLDRRVPVELLRELAARALRAAHLLGDVDGKADRAALVGERARDRLADPPRRVRRELEAELVVELLDRPDEAHVPFLDQIQERHAGLRVVAGDRHHEAQVALDQALLGGLVAEVLAPGELALLGRGQQAAVADLADVELERVGALEALVLAQEGVVGLLLFLLDGLVERGQQLEGRLGRFASPSSTSVTASESGCSTFRGIGRRKLGLERKGVMQACNKADGSSS